MSDEDNPTTPPEDSEVVASKDVRDLDEDDVKDEIDRMLAGNEPTEDHTDKLVDAADDRTESHTESVTETSEGETNTTFDTNDAFADVDPANIDPAELEKQDWTLGNKKGKELIEFKRMRFLLSEPDDDKLLDVIGAEPGEDASPSERMKDMCQLTIDAPTLTDERWDGLNIAERLGLMMEVSEYIGLNEFMDFQDVGVEARPGV